MKKASVLLVAIALALFGLAACGDDDDDDGDTAAEETTTTETGAAGAEAGGAGGTVDLVTGADAGLAYDKTQATVGAGPVTVNYDNESSTQHDVIIEDQSGTDLGGTDLISESSTSTNVELQPGNYTFYCDVPGHREGGMEGTLTVE